MAHKRGRIAGDRSSIDVTGYSARPNGPRSLRGALVVALVALVAVLLAACGDDSSSGDDLVTELRDSGTIKVGLSTQPPFSDVQDGEATGEAPEVARAIFAQMGIDTLEPVLTEFDSLIPGLIAGRFDVIAAAQVITPERCDAILFSDPTLRSQNAFAVKAGNPLAIETFEDIAANSDVRLGLVTGAADLDIAEQSGVEDGQIQKFPDLVSLLAALKADRIDAASYDNISIGYALQTGSYSDLEMTTPFIAELDGQPLEYFGGYGFRTEDEALRDAFNEEMHKLQESDGLVPIGEPFGVEPVNYEAAEGVTAEELCEA